MKCFCMWSVQFGYDVVDAMMCTHMFSVSSVDLSIFRFSSSLIFGWHKY